MTPGPFKRKKEDREEGYVKTEKETGVLPPIKEHQDHQKVEEEKEDFLLERSEGSWPKDLDDLGFLASKL